MRTLSAIFLASMMKKRLSYTGQYIAVLGVGRDRDARGGFDHRVRELCTNSGLGVEGGPNRCQR